MKVSKSGERRGLAAGLALGVALAMLGPVGIAVGFHSRPVGGHSPPRPDPNASLTVSKRADASSAVVGERDGYTITVTNPRSARATLTAIVDTLPAGFSYEAGSTSGATTADPLISGRALTWTGDFDVPAGGETFVHFEVLVAHTPGDYFNSASAVARGGVFVEPSGPTARITVHAPSMLVARPAIAELGDGIHLRFPTLSARLTWAGGPIAGAYVEFYSNVGYLYYYCADITDDDGVASCSGVVDGAFTAAAGGYEARFYGNRLFFGSSDHGELIE